MPPETEHGFVCASRVFIRDRRERLVKLAHDRDDLIQVLHPLCLRTASELQQFAEEESIEGPELLGELAAPFEIGAHHQLNDGGVRLGQRLGTHRNVLRFERHARPIEIGQQVIVDDHDELFGGRRKDFLFAVAHRCS